MLENHVLIFWQIGSKSLFPAFEVSGEDTKRRGENCQRVLADE